MIVYLLFNLCHQNVHIDKKLTNLTIKNSILHTVELLKILNSFH